MGPVIAAQPPVAGGSPGPRDGLSITGVLFGTLFFVASLAPSLIPRTYLVEGALAGLCLASGYGLGLLCRQLWRYLELPELWRLSPRAGYGALLLCATLAVVTLWQVPAWQNSARSQIGLDPVGGLYALRVALVAGVTLVIAAVVWWLFRSVMRAAIAGFRRLLPPRLATAVGFAAAVILFGSVANGLFFRVTFALLDSTFAEIDALVDPDLPRPSDPWVAGSPASLLSWEDLGRTGRDYISSAPRAADIASVMGGPALDPIRVYVGMHAADTAAERAALALDELKRLDAFKRAIMVIVTPTGTGWVDPAAMDSVEYLHRGDIASVALQYSHFSSPLSLIFEPDRGEEAAQALFSEIYRHWRTLPADARPQLYAHGLSLGAVNSEKSVDLFEMIGDPIQGALWSGPPFVSLLWRQATDARQPDSPPWLPRFRDGALIRFANQDGFTVPADAPWGPMRIVYLQYASDPITFFDHRDLYRRPEWLTGPRGPDVSPQLRWYPVVTMLQIAFDMTLANTTPAGFGHVYAPEHYIDAWIAVTGIGSLTPRQVSGLKRHLAQGRHSHVFGLGLAAGGP